MLLISCVITVYIFMLLLCIYACVTSSCVCLFVCAHLYVMCYLISSNACESVLYMCEAPHWLYV